MKAVSPAGISEGTWIGTEDDLVFPNSYSGTASYSGAVGGITETWQGTVTYTRTSQQANPDGSRQALYALSGVSLSHAASGTCSWNSGPGGTIKAGGVEIQVDAAGTWTSAFLVDVEMPTTIVSCPPAPAAPNAGPTEAFLNSRTVASGLRAMSPQGAIVGTDVTDTLATSVLPATASWNLVPGT